MSDRCGAVRVQAELPFLILGPDNGTTRRHNRPEGLGMLFGFHVRIAFITLCVRMLWDRKKQHSMPLGLPFCYRLGGICGIERHDSSKNLVHLWTRRQLDDRTRRRLRLGLLLLLRGCFGFGFLLLDRS